MFCHRIIARTCAVGFAVQLALGCRAGSATPPNDTLSAAANGADALPSSLCAPEGGGLPLYAALPSVVDGQLDPADISYLMQLGYVPCPSEEAPKDQTYSSLQEALQSVVTPPDGLNLAVPVNGAIEAVQSAGPVLARLSKTAKSGRGILGLLFSGAENVPKRAVAVPVVTAGLPKARELGNPAAQQLVKDVITQESLMHMGFDDPKNVIIGLRKAMEGKLFEYRVPGTDKILQLRNFNTFNRLRPRFDVICSGCTRQEGEAAMRQLLKELHPSEFGTSADRFLNFKDVNAKFKGTHNFTVMNRAGNLFGYVSHESKEPIMILEATFADSAAAFLVRRLTQLGAELRAAL